MLNAYDSFEVRLSDDTYKHFVNKNPPEVCKSWNSKFRKNVSKHVLQLMVRQRMLSLLMNLRAILVQYSTHLVMIYWHVTNTK